MECRNKKLIFVSNQNLKNEQKSNHFSFIFIDDFINNSPKTTKTNFKPDL